MIIEKVRVLGLLCLLLALAGNTLMATEPPKTKGIDPALFDKECKPCQDFYQYANGTWLQETEIPAEEGRYGMFNLVRDRNLAILQDILEEAAKKSDHPRGSLKQLVGDFYSSGMDTKRLNKLGIEPLKPYLADVDALKSKADLTAFIANSHALGRDYVFGFFGNSDFNDSKKQIAYTIQAGLGLPERDYYTKKDEESVALREKYVAHVARMLQKIGYDAAAAKAGAKTVLAMETTLAEASLTAVELRNPATWYNYKTLAEADAATPNFSWTAYFKTLGLAETQGFSLAHPKFFAAMDKMLAERPLNDWKTYLKWHSVNGAADFLDDDTRQANFDFFKKTLRGVQAQKPRYKQVIEATNAALGESVGQLFVARAFPPEAKARMMTMIENLRGSLHKRLDRLDWMSEETRKLALVKVKSFKPKIGYPDRWRDQSDMKIRRDSFLANALAGIAHNRKYDLGKINKPTDNNEWEMLPQVVNAYYNPLQNEIVFPAGILQPPFFDMEAHDADNYGAIGAVIGHELMHGFDDSGSQFDAEGNFKNWWTADDRQRFEARTAKLVEQYNQYEPIEGAHVNGQLTLGENIADLGGLIISFEALQGALASQPKVKVEGFTPEQRFFLSWAQAWRGKYRDETLKLRLKTDPHSPGQYRANGPLTNMETFSKAFGCQKGDPMHRTAETRVVIW
ncbi:M13 family metallopeptidase [Sulfidibacter corallicola]|uniref:M13 family metallopeptidase n=1 Tax=Sulfidibacter corallicola TaxID=2818388 RepID=A0A8A4TJ14_SULCO|nr:M13 family metallopeptidase [Sulfidibacter corallicola]QTD49916.1 M13 family metallopeptidase [Sulfidibacter corallicola]